MKSFADWTDEIRALMNPPAPMVDTCNLRDPRDLRFFDPAAMGWDEGKPSADQTATAIARRNDSRTHFDVLREEGLRAGRRLVRSHMQNMLNQFYGRLAENAGDDVWIKAYRDMVLTGTGITRVIHDEVFVDEKVFVMAPQLKIAERWARDNGISPHRLCYMHRPEHFYGTPRGIKVFSVGNWMANKRGADIDQLLEIMKVREIELEYVNDPY